MKTQFQVKIGGYIWLVVSEIGYYHFHGVKRVVNNVENPRHFVAEECNSFEEALRECAKNVC